MILRYFSKTNFTFKNQITTCNSNNSYSANFTYYIYDIKY